MTRPRNPFPRPRYHKGAAVLDVYEHGRLTRLLVGRIGERNAERPQPRTVELLLRGTDLGEVFANR